MKKDSQQDYHNRLSSGGLTQSVVLKLQEEEGYNELPKAEGRKNFAIILGVLKEPMVYILLACGIIYFVVGDQQEALMLLIFLFIIVGITIVQEAKAERALEALTFLIGKQFFYSLSNQNGFYYTTLLQK